MSPLLKAAIVVAVVSFSHYPQPLQAEDTVLAAATATKKIVLIAGKKSHGPTGNGIHDYPWSAKLLKVMFDNSNVADQVHVEFHLDGFPKDPSTLDDADTIVVISDGRDGDKYEEAPHFQSAVNVAIVQKQIDRGCGFVTFHFSTFAPDQYAQQILDWSGGYFDWEENGERKWYSAIQMQTAALQLNSPDHPISFGVKPFTLREEFYFNLRFAPEDAGLRPVVSVPTLPGRDAQGKIVAWAKVRSDGGRGFGTTCGHFYDNWKQDEFRKLVMNAIAWTAHVEVPAKGVEAKFYPHVEIETALAREPVMGKAVDSEPPIRALILTGAHHPGHHWKDTTPVIEQALLHDSRLKVAISQNMEDLARLEPGDYDLLIFNYCNWNLPGLSDAAKKGLIQYLESGGGLVIVHFANGAFHHSLPNKENTDWPEYRKICRRVWDHSAQSGHDAFGEFTVNIPKNEHPITQGLADFRTTDELYFRQDGELPIEVLATAKSNVTGQDEPMAFVYEYGKARVFQTVLGHAAESLRTPSVAAMLRKAAAWVAKRPQSPNGAAAESAAQIPQLPAPFGKALSGPGGVYAAADPKYREPPLTVECWARLDRQDQFNILIANEFKESATHWELFTRAGDGLLACYMPGMKPDHVISNVNVCDGKWHYVSMQFEPTRVRLYVDAKLVADQAVAFQKGNPKPGPLGIGALASKRMGHQGAIDEVRISRGIREISAVPTAPFSVDDATIGLWHLDEAADAKSFRDESSAKNNADVAHVDPPQTKQEPNHFGKEVVGFDWTEQDSVDSRWNQMEIGRFLASTIPLPQLEPVQKGLSIRIGKEQEGNVCYDTKHLALRAAWTGPFLKFNPARFGLIASPAIAGDLAFVSAETEGWRQPAQWKGLYQHGDNVVLSYQVSGRDILESPTLLGDATFARTLQVSPGPHAITMNIGRFGENARLQSLDGLPAAVTNDGDRIIVVAVVGIAVSQLKVTNNGAIQLHLPANEASQKIQLLTWSGAVEGLQKWRRDVVSTSALPDLSPLTLPGPLRWRESISTVGKLGIEEAPYVLDTLTIPFKNPYNALMFVGGHDFYSNGDLAVCTVHGDVWRVSGVDASLNSLHWKRMATGLFQPLGIRVLDDIAYVLGRDQITRLHDKNQDGEADYYENFCNLYQTSAGAHDYVTCLETDPAGNFYLIHATEGIVKISPQGERMEIVATGMRNPNGLAVSPTGVITAAPQEGNWTPASCVIRAQEGGYYGFGGPKITDKRPQGYDPPLCWIPRLRDNSSGGQVWVEGDRWGPLTGEMIHFSYGKCRMMLVPQEKVNGVWQGGTVEFPLTFDSGVMRGRFSPCDGQLYASGLNGWVTAAAQDGCLQRVRYTGRPVTMPAKVRTMANGIAMTFSQPLDRAAAEDVGNYFLEQWNYQYSGNYGSLDYRVFDSRQEGRDEIDLLSATLLADEKTVFLELAEVRPVDQLSIKYSLQSAIGQPVQQTLINTIHHVGSESMDENLLTRNSHPGQLPADVEAHLQQGLLLRFDQDGEIDARVSRTAAFWHRIGESPTPFLASGSFTATASGYLRVPLKGNYRFRIEANGPVELQINDQPAPTGDAMTELTLHKGYNRLQLRYASPQQGDAYFRLRWQGENFAEEPVSADLLWSDARDTELARGSKLRWGRELVATHHCFACHSPADGVTPDQFAMPELIAMAPDLRQMGARLQPDWVAQWILDPHALRPSATMPHLLNADAPTDRQTAADLAAYLAAHGEPLTQQAVQHEVDQGEILYEDLGCIACHRVSPPHEVDEFSRLSLFYAARKFHPQALQMFLQNPQQHYPASRMPNFRLSEEEAASLAAFLLKQGAEAPGAADLPPGDQLRGAKAFHSLRCDACHTLDQESHRHVAVGPMRQVDQGCLGTPSASVPQYHFTKQEATALQAFLQSDQQSLSRDPAPEASRRLVKSLNCAACHSRDGKRSPRGLILLDEGFRGLAPETLPSLTWTGDKLHAAWIERLLSGEWNTPTREWLKARMPAFPAYAQPISEGLAAEHGHSAMDSVLHEFDPDLAPVGNQLTRKEALDCRQCHGIGDELPVGDANTKIALGINFAYIRERLRPDFYHRFVLDPPRYETTTKMPKLSADGKTTKVTSIEDGDAARQFEAIWHFIQSASPASSVKKAK